MSAPVRGRRPSRFTFNIPSPAHAKPQPQQHNKYPQHPAPPPSFLLRKQDTARRRKVSTPHPIITKQPVHTPHPLIQAKAAFVDYSLSLQFSPSFSPSSCVISGLSPTSPTDSPMSDMRQRRWSAEMRRDSNDDNDDEQQEEEEEEEEDDEEQNIMSPNILSSSSCSFFSPLDSASSLDTPITSPLPSTQVPLNRKASSFPPLPAVPSLLPHRRIHSDPLPASATSSTSSLALKLNLRPLVIPPGKDGDAIIMLSAMSPIPLSQLTDRQCSYDYDEQPATDAKAAGCGVDELLCGRPMSLSECWYGRSELMSPVNGAGMMYMAAQQSKPHHLPFSNFYCGTAAAI